MHVISFSMENKHKLETVIVYRRHKIAFKFEFSFFSILFGMCFWRCSHFDLSLLMCIFLFHWLYFCICLFRLLQVFSCEYKSIVVRHRVVDLKNILFSWRLDFSGRGGFDFASPNAFDFVCRNGFDFVFRNGFDFVFRNALECRSHCIVSIIKLVINKECTSLSVTMRVDGRMSTLTEIHLSLETLE